MRHEQVKRELEAAKSDQTEAKAIDRVIKDIEDAKCEHCGGKLILEEGIYEPQSDCDQPPGWWCDDCGTLHAWAVHPEDFTHAEGDTDLIGRDE